MCDYEGINDIWFTVTPDSPSGKKALFDIKKRLDMVENAILSYDNFLASDIETFLPQPNYTLNTLLSLKSKFPLLEFVLIMGADNWPKFPKWRGAKKILEEFSIIIIPRNGFSVEISNLPLNVILSAAPIIEISSSLIRESIQNKKDVRSFFPKE